MRNFSFTITTILILATGGYIYPQQPTENKSYVDGSGVLRWGADNSEIHGFGVNYSTPFAHAFRMAQRLGISHEEAIRQDIYHFARLDFNLYRVHVWDTEISDTLGNLLQNEHLRLFDFTISEMKKRGMKYVITPIAFWGNGWPEPDFDTPGFAHKYGKAACLTHPDAIRAQENYLYQFLNHVNPYTGIAYKNDSDVIAFEVSNEPHHPGTVAEVVTFINRMIASMRRTGTTTPIFYNMTHSIHLYRAYLEADVQGGTFQWYPTGLVARRQINGNFLPHVSEYFIPFADDADFRNKAKIVYEFDAADVGGNYMYPAMARSFREVGMQIATHFDYDAMFLAPYNTNYGTHYMSLPYAPQKALSLKIASAIFQQIPRYAHFGKFPQNNQFGNFRIDYENNLVELISNKQFFYSNHTNSKPANVQNVSEIAGYGSSPLVHYDGRGAYFLDKLQNGVWRLEVMPDAYWVDDPYARTSAQRQVAAVNYRNRAMRIELPGLGSDFSISPMNVGNSWSTIARAGAFEIRPGVYLLRPKGNNTIVKEDFSFKNMKLNEYVAPRADLKVIMIKNLTPEKHTAGHEAVIRFEIISPQKPESVFVAFWGEQGSWQQEAAYTGNDRFQVLVKPGVAKHAILHYYIMVKFESYWMSFPAAKKGRPGDWDFYDHSSFQLHFVPSSESVPIWCAWQNNDETLRPWVRGIQLRPLAEVGKGVLNFNLDSVPASQDGTGNTQIYSFRYFFRDQVKGRLSELNQKNFLVVKGKSNHSNNVNLQISLIDKNANAYTGSITITNRQDVYRIALKDFVEGKFAMIPRPYPEFKPWFSGISNHRALMAEDLETIQVTLMPNPTNENSKVDFELQEIWME